MNHRHPVNVAHYDERHPSRIEAFARFFGTTRYLAIQTAVVLAWIAANVWFLTHPFDRYPFILLNLAFSTQAAYAAPLILLAANRQEERDRVAREHDFATNAEALEILRRLEAAHAEC